jgi:hypothetical protein
MAEFRSEGRFHLLAIPYEGEIAETYFPSRLANADYPQLVDVDKPVDTLAVGSILAAFSWPEGSDRYRRLERFVESFFSHFDEFLRPGRHPKWKEVNVAAETPGWERFKPAEAWLSGRRPAAALPDSSRRSEPLRTNKAVSALESERDALFREFLAWETTRRPGNRIRQSSRRRQVASEPRP